jgi:hypothetical protein
VWMRDVNESTHTVDCGSLHAAPSLFQEEPFEGLVGSLSLRVCTLCSFDIRLGL